MRQLSLEECAQIAGGVDADGRTVMESEPITITARKLQSFEVVGTVPTPLGSVGVGYASNHNGASYGYLGVGGGAGVSVTNQDHNQAEVTAEFGVQKGSAGATVGIWVPLYDKPNREVIKQYGEYFNVEVP